MSCLKIAVLVLLSAAANPAPRHSWPWVNNLHTVGESSPSIVETKQLLGPPDSTSSVIVKDPEHYAPFQPLICLRPKRGTALAVWEYREPRDKITYFLYFFRGRKVCLTSVVDGVGP